MYRPLKFYDKSTNWTFMYAKHGNQISLIVEDIIGNLVDVDTSGAKGSTKHLTV